MSILRPPVDTHSDTHSHLPKLILTLPTHSRIPHVYTTHTTHTHITTHEQARGTQSSRNRFSQRQSRSLTLRRITQQKERLRFFFPPAAPSLPRTEKEALLACVSSSLDSLKWSPLLGEASELRRRPDTEQRLSARPPAYHSPQGVNQQRPAWFYCVSRRRQIYERATSS